MVVTEMREIADRWKLPGMWRSTHFGIARRARLVGLLGLFAFMVVRSEERRVGKECA